MVLDSRITYSVVRKGRNYSRYLRSASRDSVREGSTPVTLSPCGLQCVDGSHTPLHLDLRDRKAPTGGVLRHRDVPTTDRGSRKRKVLKEDISYTSLTLERVVDKGPHHTRVLPSPKTENVTVTPITSGKRETVGLRPLGPREE